MSGEPALVVAMQRYRAGDGVFGDVIDAVLAEKVWVSLAAPREVVSLPWQGRAWVPVCSTAERLHQLNLAVRRLHVPGRVLERDLLPAVENLAGVFLDPGEPHMTMLSLHPDDPSFTASPPPPSNSADFGATV